MLLVMAVVFVNGWTDAPNAITNVVATSTLPYRKAVFLAAGGNLLGMLIMGMTTPSVAATVSAIVDFSAVPVRCALAVMCAAMLSIVLFAVCAWYFGIPTSESHALMAALYGAMAALGIEMNERAAASWLKVLLGLFMSLGMGFLFGYLLVKGLGSRLSRWSGRRLDRMQIIGAGAMAFMHGAQDGQKFVAVFAIAQMLLRGTYSTAPIRLTQHIPAMLLCALTMAVGTMAGGRRIVNMVGIKMVELKKHQGVCADIGSALCLLTASLTGVPMSTTHTKTTAIMGAGLGRQGGRVDFGVIKGMLFAWGITFPVCGILGYLLACWLLRVL